MIIEKGRYEVHLDIRPVIGSEPADNEAARFGNIRTAGPLAAEQVANSDADFVQLVIGYGFFAAHQCADIEMILQVPAHSRKIQPDIDIPVTQMVGRTNTRQHQQLR